MISRIKIKNFKSIIDLEIDLNQGKTIFVGQNEAGKSSIIEALHAFQTGKSDLDNLNYECFNDNNFRQEISITYDYRIVKEHLHEEDLVDDIQINIKNSGSNHALSAMIVEPNLFESIGKIELSRNFIFENGTIDSFLLIDSVNVEKIISRISSKIIETPDSNNAIDFDIKETINKKEVIHAIADTILYYFPEIVVFNSFSDLLPDKIPVSVLADHNSKAEGKEAVKNIEAILDSKFSDWSKQIVSRKKTNTEKGSKFISVDFLRDWNQKIDNNNELKIEFSIERDVNAIEEVHFFIETKEGVKLEPRKRSQGLRWFLSLWLDIKSKSKHVPLILVFDEPGAHLHINAMKDMVTLFDKMVQQGNQIIYSTHLPSMIDLTNLENLRLVIHDKIKGTMIEKLTSSRFDSHVKRDALQPIAQAMGMQPLTEFSVLRQKNVLVEGLSDMLYFNAMKKILNKTDDYAIVPGIGIKDEKLNTLISFCIGYGLEWLVVIDNGYNPAKFIQQLTKSFQDEDSSDNEMSFIYTTKFEEIEDIFSYEDINLLGLKVKNSPKEPVSKLVGSRKILFAQQFNNLVNEGKISISNLNQNTVKEFERIFEWIEEKFKKE